MNKLKINGVEHKYKPLTPLCTCGHEAGRHWNCNNRFEPQECMDGNCICKKFKGEK